MLTVSLHCKLQDHLHIRGEYRFLLIFCFGHPGSPPHTWRIPDMITVTNGATRITSTYVENTFTPFGIITNGIGSPPHTWRIPLSTYLPDDDLRITSTYVENTTNPRPAGGGQEDHLHIRGEYPALVVPTFLLLGSPPHTWRILEGGNVFKDEWGITSTYVENTRSCRLCQLNHWDHLHIRGEYPTDIFCVHQVIGSPPHTWRIRNQFFLQHWLLGITSTYVENTFSICCLLARLRDHLHIRGEYFGVVQLVHITKGSPPHTWRILNSSCKVFIVFRITSTYVENTKPYHYTYKYAEDHLHIRGEYSNAAFLLIVMLGSPPHTWRILG